MTQSRRLNSKNNDVIIAVCEWIDISSVIELYGQSFDE